MLLHYALVGVGPRDRIRICAAGKVATGTDTVKRLIQGTDYTNGPGNDDGHRLPPVPALPHQSLPLQPLPSGRFHPGSE